MQSVFAAISHSDLLSPCQTTHLATACSHTVALHILNSLGPVRSQGDSKNVFFNLVLLIGIFRSSHDNALQWIPQDLTDVNKSTLLQVMAWCRQATSHYLSQCWLSFLSPYDVTRPQWVYLGIFCCLVYVSKETMKQFNLPQQTPGSVKTKDTPRCSSLLTGPGDMTSKISSQ